MGQFANWMRSNRVALLVATGMFAIMATVMAVMIAGYDFSLIMDVFASPERQAVSPFLWVWRIGGLLTWPVFMLLLLLPYRNPSDEDSGRKLLSAGIIAGVYGGFGMWVTNYVTSLFLSAVSEMPNQDALVAPVVLVLDVLSILYTWGFCAIYGFGLKSMVGGQRENWVPISIAMTVIGQWVSPIVIMIPMSIVLSMVLRILMVFMTDSFVAYAIPIAIALSTGNFMGQWLSFWQVHDKVLGVHPAVPQPMPVPAPYAYQQGMPQGTQPVAPNLNPQQQPYQSPYPYPYQGQSTYGQPIQQDAQGVPVGQIPQGDPMTDAYGFPMTQ